MADLRDKYGDLEKLHAISKNPKDLEERLKRFKGIGPVCVNIFLRELRGIWAKAKPAPSKLALEAARKLRFEDVERYESVLVRLTLEYCKKSKCSSCPLRMYCTEKTE